MYKHVKVEWEIEQHNLRYKETDLQAKNTYNQFDKGQKVKHCKRRHQEEDESYYQHAKVELL